MLNLLYLMTLGLLLPVMIIMMNFLLSKQKKKNREKNTPFECGFDPLSNARMPFSNQFFLITLLFLIFDVEIMMIIPIILMINYYFLTMMSMIFIFFLIMLMLGLWMEWSFNYLTWIN